MADEEAVPVARDGDFLPNTVSGGSGWRRGGEPQRAFVEEVGPMAFRLRPRSVAVGENSLGFVAVGTAVTAAWGSSEGNGV